MSAVHPIFEPLLSHLSGKRPTFEREVGSPVKGWHACGRTASYEVTSETAAAVRTLHYCDRHLEAGQSRESKLPSFRLLKVRPL